MDQKITGVIKSENPENHWGFLNVEGKVLLDMGCGINNQEFVPTPWYFHQEKKCRKIIGVDGNQQSYAWFQQNFNVKNFILFQDLVDRYEKFEFYFTYFKPEVVKMDIEGSEILMYSLSNHIFDSVEQIGIEYHSYPCLVACKSKLEELGYTIEYYKFENLDLDHQGVIYGYKN